MCFNRVAVLPLIVSPLRLCKHTLVTPTTRKTHLSTAWLASYLRLQVYILFLVLSIYLIITKGLYTQIYNVSGGMVLTCTDTEYSYAKSPPLNLEARCVPKRSSFFLLNTH